MSGISIGGLVTGLDSNTLIEQLMRIESQPLVRYQDRISGLEEQKDAIQSLRSTLQTLRDRAQDFKLFAPFDQFAATSSEEGVLLSEVSGPSPVQGSYSVT